ncbi:MAG: DNA-processing protein DprA [candidate division KSB1 bacterium]|nr:DNA-processing protein DprA [candidate division KSB1 bacterium]MDZ7273046.1 DNA-processing protein DprA [candidate division KSB1 bacterium]MDZ7298181.1 DNA-processing protein DprA [candidate division KSB1 bacterium]MDZ7349186.1 DNA-processing protein DprA [candidate division KSB1 bacterium]MDZ7352848.1 DNA-processing protein DprA [candidate division KSB1 bacterium]
METKELEALIQLLAVPGIGPARVRALMGHFRSGTAVLQATSQELCQVPGIDQTLAENLLAARNPVFAQQQLAIMQRRHCRIVTFWDDEYPGRLKNISDAPVLLHVQGSLAPVAHNAVAIVGTRSPTSYGRLATEKIVTGLVARGITIVSGLARGIDTIAHRTVLQNGGRTVAVLGSGLDVVYPAENRGLMEEIAGSGAVISEFPFGTKPDAVNFPRRNRIISGLSLGVVVIEAGRESGALITASYALEQGREIFALPGNIFSAKSAGPHQLIREGARLIESADEILEELQGQLELFASAVDEHPLPPDLQESDLAVYHLLSHEPVHIDILTRKLARSSAQVMAILLELELRGLIRQLPGKFFVRA